MPNKMTYKYPLLLLHTGSLFFRRAKKSLSKEFVFLIISALLFACRLHNLLPFLHHFPPGV